MVDWDGLKVDADRCTGCGACIQACPHGAITLANGVAVIDDQACTRCEACLEACPEDAILPWVQGEVIVLPEDKPVRADRPPTLARAAGTAIAAASAGLLLRAVDALSGSLAQWLSRPISRPTPSKNARTAIKRGGRRQRHRRRRWRR